MFVRNFDRTILQTLPVPGGGMSFHGIVADPAGTTVFVTGTHNALWIARAEGRV